ncbi:hypothetical protein K439DRAFT_621098 [Ramaria rubella]|nr:hypothetical protein K439DRAFT_621098 [Ramaria rubella]
MVRATRSTAAFQNQGAAEQSHPPAKKLGKKRKRGSNVTDPEEQRAAKQRRSESNRIDEEPGTGDLPLNSQDAAKILDVLEMIDTQGLLDRVFPLPESDASSSSKASTSKDAIKTYSLRALLKDSAMHPLRVLRSAIRPLFPISSHPRSRPSVPAAQQLHFCNLALSLLDQSSSQNRPALSLSQSTLFPDSDADMTPAGVSNKRRRYALVQRLPGGEWWSSSNTAREGELGLTTADAKDMRKGQAELVSIIPALPLSPSSMPTLGELQMEGRKEPRHRFKAMHMHPRTLSSGTFLDYGPFTSFAPAFDSEGAEVGRDGLGQMLMGRLERRKIKEARRKLIVRLQAEQEDDVRMVDSSEMDVNHEMDGEAIDSLLESLLPGEKADGFKSALQALKVEDGVACLLVKNARALERLNLLQTVRLRSGNASAKEDSEEYKIAQEIMNSLTLLTSLRPRPSSDPLSVTQPPLIPPASVIRALHSTLPASATSGWQGTLDESRKTALRDDSTIHVKAGAPQVISQPPATTSQPYGAGATYAQNSSYRPQAAYPYHTPQNQQRPAVQSQAQNQSAYYPNAYLQVTKRRRKEILSLGQQRPTMEATSPNQERRVRWVTLRSHNRRSRMAGLKAMDRLKLPLLYRHI